ncbi:group 1 truncated hemoglobin [Simiduia curdlanivorans]|uniref:Group 1 truncated hemoglobin n=1 Tax=Simiduia curdlanivorans TaxID=1492769 RepID=A0ABV8V1R4_9GAMM|nr:group 1 truncated hemoglobin [Simiduia curdlanivorans]MDN3637820.1 group 1 truncated hemoglobin [Simiduia curdlanivorans]
MNSVRTSITWLLLVFMLASCSHLTEQSREQSLYQRLGGAPGIATIVDNFLYQIGESDVLRPLFVHTDIERFHEKLSEQLCEISGGPCRYSGDEMTEVHAGLAMNNRHFDAVVNAFISAMEQADVEVSAQNALLEKLAAMHADVMRDVVAPS